MSTGSSEDRTPREPQHLRRVLTLWIVLSVVGVVLAIVVIPLANPTAASAVAGFANSTNVVFTALAVPVAMFVCAFVFYSIFAFRERTPPDGDVEQLEDGPPLVAKPRQQVWWLVITAALAFFTVAWGMFGFYNQTAAAPANPLVVDVTGQQWLWTFYYPSLGVQSRTLELPVGQPVQFRITSKDVLHGFVIDSLGVAMDANPGWVSVAPTVTPTRIGNYTAHCVELCGLYHTYMWSNVDVVKRAAFTSWAAAQRAATTSPVPATTPPAHA